MKREVSELAVDHGARHDRRVRQLALRLARLRLDAIEIEARLEAEEEIGEKLREEYATEEFALHFRRRTDNEVLAESEKDGESRSR